MADSYISNMRKHLDRLRELRYGGIRSVRDQSGEEVHYKSDKELEAAIRAAESELHNDRYDQLTTAYLKTSKGV